MPPSEYQLKAFEGEGKATSAPAPAPGTPRTPSQKSLIVVDYIPDEYARIRKRALSPDKERNNPDSRYKDGSYRDAERFVLPGPERSPWVRGEDPLDSRKYNSTTYGKDQIYMLYFTGDTFRLGNRDYSVFNNEPIRWSNGPMYGPENVRLPVNTRPGSDYLGACYLDIPDANLHALFPAEVAEDGFPFGDHIPSGNSFMPRLSKNDLPSGGKTVPDSRIAFLRCPNGDVVFFGGEYFKVENITDYQWRNLHHYFIDITGRRGRDLPSAFDHPEEARRRRALPQQTKALSQQTKPDMFCPTGTESQFACAAETVSGALDKVLVSTFLYDPNNAPEITTDERSDILDALPTRGYNVAVPTYEIISHLALSGTAYAAGTKALLVQSEIDFEKHKKIIESIDGMLSLMAEAQFTPSGISDDSIAQMLLELRGDIVDVAQPALTLRRGVEAAIDGIPLPKSIARYLPVSVYGSSARRLCNATDTAIRSTTIEPECTIFPARENWKEELNPSDDNPAWMTMPANPPSFLAPYSTTPTAKRTDQLLRKALSTPIRQTATTIHHPDMTPSRSKSKDGDIPAKILRPHWGEDGEKTDEESAKAWTKHEGPPPKQTKVEASPTRMSPRKHAPRRNLDLTTTQTNKWGRIQEED
jgi:hypothetical protein